MQIASKTIPHKQTGLERKAQSNDKTTSLSNNSIKVKTLENDILLKDVERNETSQYLKVLSRIENLLIQNK